MPTLRYRLALRGWRSLSDVIFVVLVNLWPYRRNVVLINLARCFPNLSEREVKQMLTAYFRHLADLIVAPFMLSNVKKNELDQLVMYDNIELIRELLAQNKSIVLMASHYGNWEYLLSLPLQTNCQVLAAYSPVSNRLVNSWLCKMRSRFGIKLIPKSEWYRQALGWCERTPAIFVTIADQRPPESGKYYLDFMNRKTFIQSGAARIAINRNAAVVYLDVVRKERNAYCFKFNLITANASRLGEADIMERYYKALETTIKRQPELWLWSHNRWKFSARQGQKPVSVRNLV